MIDDLPPPLGPWEGQHQGSRTHVGDVEGECEVRNAAVWQLVKTDVVGFTLFGEHEDLEVVCDAYRHLFTIA